MKMRKSLKEGYKTTKGERKKLNSSLRGNPPKNSTSLNIRDSLRGRRIKTVMGSQMRGFKKGWSTKISFSNLGDLILE